MEVCVDLCLTFRLRTYLFLSLSLEKVAGQEQIPLSPSCSLFEPSLVILPHPTPNAFIYQVTHLLMVSGWTKDGQGKKVLLKPLFFPAVCLQSPTQFPAFLPKRLKRWGTHISCSSGSWEGGDHDEWNEMARKRSKAALGWTKDSATCDWAWSMY